jgi:Uma2 family endonuclease
MITTLQHPRTIYQIWENLPEGTMCQIINNALVMSPSPLDIHQVILNEINVNLTLYVRKIKTGYVRISPYDVHLSKSNILQPDICFITEENKNNIGKKGLTGAPDLVIEILSPGTKKYDLTDKKDIYQNYGVKEYFIVEPTNRKVKSFVLKNNKYIESEETTGIIKSALLKTSIAF